MNKTPSKRMEKVEQRIKNLAVVEQFDTHDTEVFRMGYLQATLDASNGRV